MRLLASGRDADVFEAGSGKVLRRYRDAAMDATPEAVVMRHVHARGYPVPMVYDVAGPDIVLAHVHGPTMLEMLMSGAMSPADGAAMTADLLDLLHAIPAPDDLVGPSRVAVERAADDVVLHLDLHPMNVLVAPGGPVVIDWCNARRGPAGLDRAVTALILAQVASGELAGLGPGARAMFEALLGLLGPLTHVDEALAYRATDPNMSADERASLDRAAALLTP
ncbi:phosphotransferase [Luteipulveratus halotolerans]|uniref:Aminoglycoside phosphotransferase domain-containing protein n=1 Tax=Luteipulveratus halotolerans TaxID=1631356 RepID=A0A0L6CLA1_9MICO|nr:phosphotransferase [Luteipulveratus halotolerans]KNX38484.1 hypothetical protein VV01_17175 [Luteipulveratus halotolerans]